MQAKTVLCFLALALVCFGNAEATGYYGGYYGGGHHRRLSEATGFGRQLLTGYYGYYGSHHRRLFTSDGGYYYGGYSGHHRRMQESAMIVRPLFGDAFMPLAQAAADIPVPQFLSRQLQTVHPAGYYYGGYHHRRLSHSDSHLPAGGYYGGYYGHK